MKPPPMTTYRAPDLYGPVTNTACGRRNDHRCVANPGPKEVFVCRFCKRATIISFAKKEKAA